MELAVFDKNGNENVAQSKLSFRWHSNFGQFCASPQNVQYDQGWTEKSLIYNSPEQIVVPTILQNVWFFDMLHMWRLIVWYDAGAPQGEFVLVQVFSMMESARWGAEHLDFA